MSRWYAMAYAGGVFAVYLMMAFVADVSEVHAWTFHWWHPALAAFTGSLAVIPAGIYFGQLDPMECSDCDKADRRLMRVEKERDELKQALLALEPPK